MLGFAGPEPFLKDPEAMQAFTDAQAAFNAQNFEEASRLLEKAYMIEPKTDLLYPWAQAERNLGNCDVAIDLYQQFLDAGAEGQFAEAAQQNIDRCKEEVGEEEEEIIPVPTDDPLEDELEEEEEEEPEPEPVKREDDQPKTKKWYADPVGGVLFGVGLAGVGAGVGLLGVAGSTARGAPNAATNDGYLEERDRATTFRNAGAIVLSIGGALLVGAIIRYAVVAKKNKQPKSAHLRPSGLGLTGRF